MKVDKAKLKKPGIRHIVSLDANGHDFIEYLVAGEDSENYTFKNKKTGEIIIIKK